MSVSNIVQKVRDKLGLSSHSRQYEWSRHQIELGNCATCGKPRKKYKKYCDECRKIQNEYEAARRHARKLEKQSVAS